MLVSSPLYAERRGEERRGEERRDNEKLMDPTQTLQVKVVKWGGGQTQEAEDSGVTATLVGAPAGLLPSEFSRFF
jgi:hypothetical protein